MFIATVDEMIAVLEVERDRIGGGAPIRLANMPFMFPSDASSVPFVKGGWLRKDGTVSSRKTAAPCVFISTGDDYDCD